ncbi:hypothetical protein G6L30_33620 [Agrobacterium rhizogenes]|nr:hypothetical protein [Rhizobium rhizogenes]
MTVTFPVIDIMVIEFVRYPLFSEGDWLSRLFTLSDRRSLKSSIVSEKAPVFPAVYNGLLEHNPET